jgi:hypothetical protein
VAEVVVRGVVVAIAEDGNFVDEAGVADEVVKLSARFDEPVVLGGVAPLKVEE